MFVCAEADAVGAEHHGGAAGGADGVWNVGAFEEDALFGEAVDVGSVVFVDFVAVGTHPGGGVFLENPEDVGEVFGVGD